MKIKLKPIRLPMSTRIGYRHASERDYDRSLEKMDIAERLSDESNEEDENVP